MRTLVTSSLLLTWLLALSPGEALADDAALQRARRQ